MFLSLLFKCVAIATSLYTSVINDSSGRYSYWVVETEEVF